MVAIGMSPMPPKVIGRDACLQTKGLSKLLKDFEPKRCPNTYRRDESKNKKLYESGGRRCAS